MIPPRPAQHPPPTRHALPKRSPVLMTLFEMYVRYYVPRHLHAVRLSRSGWQPPAPELPLIVVLNHPSWWDPLLGIILSRLFPGREHYVPIDAATLARYRFFGRLGFFGVEQGTRRGAAQFLHTSLAILARPHAMLWVTAQGTFTDPRVRPVRLRSGVGHLARCLNRAALLPLAIEYPFWEERTPEALARFGEPLLVHAEPTRSARSWTSLLERRLEATQDELAAEACGRNPQDFTTLVKGRAGVGGIYDSWQWLRATLRGERYRAEHGRAGAEESASW